MKRFFTNVKKLIAAESNANTMEQLVSMGLVKEVIEKLEEQNQDIAEQNDGLKEGMFEGQKNLKKMEKLQVQVQKVVDELSE